MTSISRDGHDIETGIFFTQSYVGGRELWLKFEVEILDKLRVRCRTTKTGYVKLPLLESARFFPSQ